MKAQADHWRTVCRMGHASLLYVAHPVPGGWRLAERTDERFPEWVTVSVEEFESGYEVVPEVEQPPTSRKWTGKK